MITVIVAGGSGTRLWPLSTSDYPKHLLKVNSDRSLLQHTFDRAKQFGDMTYVVSHASHIEHVRQQLPELNDEAFIVESERRGTASCVLAAMARISKDHDVDEPIAFLWADHFVRDKEGFKQSFKVAGQASSAHKRIVLVGIEPDYPATGFGYIHKGSIADEQSSVWQVQAFKEKPDHSTAQQYLHSGEYLWNSGYFVASVAILQQAMTDYAPHMLTALEQLRVATTPEEYDQRYLALETITIERALTEKMQGDLLVVPADFDWMDLGSFNDLAKAVDSDDDGNFVSGHVELEEVENSYVDNHEDKPVAVIGLDNVVVVNTPAGILVTRKDLSQKVGDVSKRLQQ